MTTENQIQVNLQKFKSKKQNLGAIEDAIKESQSEALGWIDTMRITYQDLENTIEESLDTIMTQIDILDEYSKELQADFLEAQENFKEVNQGLLDNNIEGGQFNDDVVREMISGFQDKISNVVRLVNTSYEMARV